MAEVLVPDMLAARAAEAPDGVALVLDGVGQLTFGQWHEKAGRVAHALRARGVAPSDRVALVVSTVDWLDLAVGYFGVLRAGAVALPLSARLAGPERAAAAGQAGCVGTLWGVDAAAGTDGTLPGWSAPLSELTAEGGPDILDRVGPDHPAQLLYTAGTTGTPKLVAASHRNVLAGWVPGAGTAHQPGRYFVHATPVACNAGQVTLLHPLQEPHTAVLLPRFDPRRYAELVQRHAADHTLLVPAMASWLVESGNPDGYDLSSVRSVALTAAPATPALLAAVDRTFPAARVTNCYTSTEAWPAMTAMDYDPTRPGALGRPLPGQRVEVVGPDGGSLPAGETGEIALATGGIPARGYLGDTESSGAVFAQGRVRTGDLGYLDDDGYLYLVDRRSDLIVTGGMNVSCLEVEGALAGHPAVAEAAVTGLDHPTLGTMVAAAVVTRRPVPVAELRDWLRPRLADYKLPAVVLPVDELPRNELGKVLRSRLRAVLTAGMAADGAAATTPVPPRTDDERILLRAWCEVLGRYDLGVEHDFIAVGGHSLAAFQIAELASASLSVPLPRSLLLTTPTVAAQATAVAALRRDGTAAVSTPIRRRRRPSGRPGGPSQS
ncbi:MAG: AMP-binding protein [Actinocatenispora sp.]